MTVQHEGGRDYLSRLYGGVDMSTLSNEEVVNAIDSQYPGGWSEFAKGWGASPVTQGLDCRETVRREPTRFQMMQSVQKMTGQAIRLGLLDEVLEIKIREASIIIDLRVFQVVEQSNRWKVINEGLRRLTWHKVNHFWIRKHDEVIWIPEGLYEARYVHNFGSIQTDDVWNDKRDQWHLCYRPGTAKSPMDGPESLDRAGTFEYYDRYERKHYGADD